MRAQARPAHRPQLEVAAAAGVVEGGDFVAQQTAVGDVTDQRVAEAGERDADEAVSGEPAVHLADRQARADAVGPAHHEEVVADVRERLLKQPTPGGQLAEPPVLVASHEVVPLPVVLPAVRAHGRPSRGRG